ncbi:MAG: alkaline phosphatase family protein, partial [Thermomicrobiaceae bacterium]|nr:alkaline phosphatase family protein [Thermomicrobiaceae bacterium]
MRVERMIQMNGRRTRVAVIGLDGASLPLLERLAAEGVMPNIGRLLARGASGPLESVIPTNSIAAWSSFMTGQRPEQHRAFSFTVRDPRDFARKQIVNATFLRGQTLWDLLSRAGQSVGVYNVPLTYPARPVNGFMVTGLMTPSTEREFTYPADLTPALLGEVPGYMLDVGWMRYQGRPADLVRDLVAMTRQRVAALRFLLSRYDPDFAIAVFVSPDRIQHALWREIDPRHPDHDPAEAAAVMPHIHAFYRALDEAVGETMALLGSGYDLLVMSDHGFHRVARQVLLNEWLSQEGLLQWSSPGRRRVQQSLQAAKRYLRKRVGRQAAQRVRRVIRHRANVSDDTAIDWSRT